MLASNGVALLYPTNFLWNRIAQQCPGTSSVIIERLSDRRDFRFVHLRSPKGWRRMNKTKERIVATQRRRILCTNNSASGYCESSSFQRPSENSSRAQTKDSITYTRLPCGYRWIEHLRGQNGPESDIKPHLSVVRPHLTMWDPFAGLA